MVHYRPAFMCCGLVTVTMCSTLLAEVRLLSRQHDLIVSSRTLSLVGPRLVHLHSNLESTPLNNIFFASQSQSTITGAHLFADQSHCSCLRSSPATIISASLICLFHGNVDGLARCLLALLASMREMIASPCKVCLTQQTHLHGKCGGRTATLRRCNRRRGS